MCGIFGGIGKGVNPGTIRALALINRERGTDSLGFFDSSGRIIKMALDPLEALGTAEFAAGINRGCSKGWFIAGHTRYATRGSVTSKNAHPFRYGHIIGCHNGMVDAPKHYNVDSEFLFDRLRNFADYQEALGRVGGYWGLTWFDGAHFYIQAHENSVYLCKSGNAWYYSSDDEHLMACVGSRKIIKMSGGATIRFSADCSTYERMPDLVNHEDSWGFGYRSKTNGKSKKTKKSGFAGGSVSGSGSTGSAAPAGGKDWLQTYNLLDNAETAYADELALDQGFKDFDEFMSYMGLTNEGRAYDLLVDCAHAGGTEGVAYTGRKSNSLWDENDNYVGGTNS